MRKMCYFVVKSSSNSNEKTTKTIQEKYLKEEVMWLILMESLFLPNKLQKLFKNSSSLKKYDLL